MYNDVHEVWLIYKIISKRLTCLTFQKDNVLNGKFHGIKMSVSYLLTGSTYISLFGLLEKNKIKIIPEINIK